MVIAVSKAQQKAVNKHVLEEYDRINVTMPKGKKETIQAYDDKMLMKALFHFAMERGIVAKDYSEFVPLPGIESRHEKGAFNDVQIKKLKQMAAGGLLWANTALMLRYT